MSDCNTCIAKLALFFVFEYLEGSANLLPYGIASVHVSCEILAD